MYIEEIKKQQGNKVYTSILIRESYRDNGKVKHRTVANISKLPAEHVRQLKASLKGEKCNYVSINSKSSKIQQLKVPGIFILT